MGRSSFPVALPHRVLAALVLAAALTIHASDTPRPDVVATPGTFQTELGCSADWQPECERTRLAFDAEDDVWQAIVSIPAGSWEYKAALNGSWDENYGANGQRNGPNIGLPLSDPRPVKFYYDHKTHWIADNVNKIIATAPGNFQSELGCAVDWDPSCLRSWLQDPDGDGIYTFSTSALPAGSYEVKVAIGESWDENYGADGIRNGANIPFTVPSDCAEVRFAYDSATHLLTIGAGVEPTQPSSVTIAASVQSELGCPGDWQPDCAATRLAFDTADQVWQATFSIPAGSWEYKAALNGSWDENYGANAQRNGPNIGLSLSDPRPVKFYYDHKTHWIADNVNKIIATAPGNFQSELGCPGDWQPDCLRSWLQDPDGDGIYTFSTSALPAGSYEVKVAIGESWDENYGAGGVRNGANIPFSVPDACGPIIFVYDSSTHVLTVGAEGAPRGDLSKARAHWVSRDTVVWRADGRSIPESSWTVQLHYDTAGGLRLGSGGVSGGAAIPLTYDPAGLAGQLRAKFPHLAGHPVFRLPANRLGEVPAALQGQLAVSAVTADGVGVDATSLQIPGALDDLYFYDGLLGVAFDGATPTLRLWAPTARSVKLHVFDSPAGAVSGLMAMTRDTRGVWSVTGEPSWNRKFYLYEVEVFVSSTGRVERNVVTDPYSLSLSRNSRRSQMVSLDDPLLKPGGWDRLVKPRLEAPEDATIYELHVRDFSASDASVPEALRGTFRAFTERASNGMRHLASLARAGLTHVHLLPSFDIATIDEDKSQWRTPAGDLSVYPPDSDRQQAAVMAVADQDAYNWGYDPWHYTVPEGSYSADADGPTRILEFREMVKTLNQTGLRVIMDVVYNHTNAAGQSERSVLDRIVPGYYHRLNAAGDIETSTCCQNTATEHDMMEKLMIDSALTWARGYKVDGFRFDLMGHHMKRNMTKLRSALDALTMADDGVDGRQIYLYGEGWNFGEVANNTRGVNATQQNMADTGIGTFNDRLRDGVRGGGPFSGLKEQGFLTGLFYDPNATPQGSPSEQRDELLRRSDWIRIGLAGNLADYRFIDRFGDLVRARDVDYQGQAAGYTTDPQEVINYVEAHDNETFFDAIQLKADIAETAADRVRMQNLGMSLLAFGQGVPFFHAGVELLRSKSLDRNSYNSGDWFNRLDYSYATNNWGVGLPPAADNGSNWPVMAPLLANRSINPGLPDIRDALDHFLEVLAIRRSSPLFRLRTAADVVRTLRFHNTGPDQLPGLIVMSLSDEDGRIDSRVGSIVVLFNANDESQWFSDPAFVGRRLHLHPRQAASADPIVRTAAFDQSSGAFLVPARTAAVFWSFGSAVAENAADAGELNASVWRGRGLRTGVMLTSRQP